MTEAEWLSAIDPCLLLNFIGDKASERQRRLFERACCRRVWDELADERSRHAVEMAEEYADGLVSDDQLEAVAAAASEAWPDDQVQFTAEGHLLIPGAAYNVAIPLGWWGGAPAFMPPSSIVQNSTTNPATEKAAQAALVRDIFVSPFRVGVAIDPDWCTSAVFDLALKMYDSRDFSQMPILGHALKDAGCENVDMLDHCAPPEPHVRGCWLVDAILGTWQKGSEQFPRNHSDHI